jgi:hypothetical protein
VEITSKQRSVFSTESQWLTFIWLPIVFILSAISNLSKSDNVPMCYDIVNSEQYVNNISEFFS